MAFSDRVDRRENVRPRGPVLKFDNNWFHLQNKKKEKGRRKRQYKYMKFDIENKKEEPLFFVTSNYFQEMIIYWSVVLPH